MGNMVTNPIQFFPDRSGLPLDDGSVFIGSPNTNPMTNPVAVYQDAALTIPMQQPLKTTQGAFSLNGTPLPVYIAAAAYSMAVLDKGGNIVMTLSNVANSLFSQINRVVNSIAQLRTLPSLLYSNAFVTGYYSPHDGGGGAYQLDPNDTTSADNGGTIIVASDGGRWKLQAIGPVSIKQFGAKGDGLTDDSACIQAALNCGAVAIYALPEVTSYRCATGITVPAGVAFFADGFMPSNPPHGAILMFDLAVATCVTMGGASAGNKSCRFTGFNVMRAAGAPPAGSIGVYNQNTYGSIVEDVNCVGHAIPFYLKNDGNENGITCNINRLYTGGATDSHVVIDSFPEARFNQCRFGMNGSGDQNCNSYVRIQGGSTSNPADGPNTTVFVNCHFNQGVNSANAWVAFQNLLAGSISDTTLFQFDTCYVEDAVTGIFSDASWLQIGRLQISNSTFNGSAATQFLALNTGTQINNWTMVDSIINAAWTLASTEQINFLSVADTEFLGLVSIAGVTGSVVTFADNTYIAGLTLSGVFANGVFGGGSIAGGSLTNTATGNLSIDVVPYNSLTNWNPQLAFGGSSTGITYSVQQATYQIIGNMVFCEIYIQLTSKGTATGSAEISNLPVADKISWAGGAGGGPVTTAVNMASLTSAPVVAVSLGTAQLFDCAATGFSPLTDANFTNTTLLRAAFSYVRA